MRSARRDRWFHRRGSAGFDAFARGLVGSGMVVASVAGMVLGARFLDGPMALLFFALGLCALVGVGILLSARRSRGAPKG